MATDSNSDDFDIINRQEASLETDLLAQIRAWLQPTDYETESSEFHRHLSSQAPGTGLWICETKRYRQWHDSDEHGSLWIKGVPGAGKSVTAASIAEHLKGTENAPVLFFFFRYIILANRTPRCLVRDWLAQLLADSPRLQAILQPLLGSDLQDHSDEQLWEYLLIGLSSMEKAYCLVDAMDEIDLVAKDGFLRRLNDLATFRPASVKLLMTSRPKQYLQSSLGDASIVHISLERDLVGKDIAAFVSHRLESIVSGTDQKSLRNSLKLSICTRSAGLFLYARLILDQIIPILRSKQQIDVETFANTLPVGLQDMYDSMLIQQAEALKIETRIQVCLLEYITHSSRPLRLNELASALESAFPPSTLSGTPKAIARSACAPLLEISEDETVQVIHHSFTEFLMDVDRPNTHSAETIRRFPSMNPTEVHKKLAIACLKYLQSGSLRFKGRITQGHANEGQRSGISCQCEADECECDDQRNAYDYQGAKLQHPFLEYAVRNWAYHASHYDIEDEDFFSAINNFLDPNGVDFRRWLFIEWTVQKPSSDVQTPSPLHIAAFSGLTGYALSLLRKGQSVHSVDVDQRTPLHWACRRGHTEMALLLLHNGANSDAQDCRGVKPLHEAARKNYASIVKLLLESGVDPLTPKTREEHNSFMRGGEQSTKGETAVEYVCQQGHTDSILVMFPFLPSETLEEVLCESCRYGKAEAVQAVLANFNVSPNSKFCGATALYLAVQAHSVLCVEALLAKGADVHLMSKWQPRRKISMAPAMRPARTPLHNLILTWMDQHISACHAILQSLVKAGADPEVRDDGDETLLLSMFAQRRTLDAIVVKTLLEAGAQSGVTDKAGDTALHRLLRCNRDLEILELLLEYGADVHLRGRNGDTVLHAALSLDMGPNDKVSSITNVVKLLLGKGVQCDIKNDFGSTALEAAAENRHCSSETFGLLLQSCTDADARRRCLWLLDRQGSQQKIVEFIQRLLAVGASLEARDKEGRTALLANVRSDTSFGALIQCGARLDVVDAHGRGVLHNYVLTTGCSCSVQRFSDLVQLGLDPCKVDNDGNSLLHYVVRTYGGSPSDVEFIHQLLDYGISINTQNALGQTPLHVHIEHSRVGFSMRKPTLLPFLSLFQRADVDLDVNAQDAEGLTSLHLAVLHSQTGVATLLAAGADATILSKNRRSVLHLACRARKSDTLGFLLQEMGNRLLNKADSFGRTPLHDACTSGRPESVYYLLKSGANVSAKDHSGRTPLHACAEFPAEQHIWSLLKDQDDAAAHLTGDRYRPVPGRPSMGKPWYATPWTDRPYSTDHDSARVGGIVRSLLVAGADATVHDSMDQMPFDLALSHGCQDMIESLCAADPDLNLTHPQLNDSQCLKLRTEVLLRQRSAVPISQIPEMPLREILQNPASYLHLLTYEDVDWVAKNGGNVTGEKNDFSYRSLLHEVASRGLTEMMERLESLARCYDDPEYLKALLDKCEKDVGYPEHVAPTLHAACERESPNMGMMELLVDRCGVDVNAHALEFRGTCRTSEGFVKGRTALHRLAEAQSWWQLDAMKFLVKRGADVNSRNQEGETPLHIASVGTTLTNMDERVGFWKPACVKHLLDLGANPNALDDAGLSCLHKASSSPEIMLTLLQRGADLSAGKPSPLFWAIRAHNVQAMRIILDVGGDPNGKDTTKSCPMHDIVEDQERYALFCASLPGSSEKDYIPLVKLLIERGADLWALLTDRETLIHYVFEHAEYAIVDAFLEFVDQIDFNVKDQLGRSVFLAACDWHQDLPEHRHGGPKVRGQVLKLLDCGADVRVVDAEGRNALHHLLDNADMEQDTIVEFLEDPVCKELLHQKDGKGFSPLQCSLRTLRPVLCEALLAMGADLLEPDPTGATALHHIASQCLRFRRPRRLSYDFEQEYDPVYHQGCLRLWQKYLDLGGDINVRGPSDSPPLFHYLSSAVFDGYKNNATSPPEKLERCCHVEHYAELFADADVHARNADGESALQVVARREGTYHTTKEHEKKLFEFIVAKGLDPLAEDARGRSSLDVAAACEKKEILELYQYRS